MLARDTEHCVAIILVVVQVHVVFIKTTCEVGHLVAVLDSVHFDIITLLGGVCNDKLGIELVILDKVNGFFEHVVGGHKTEYFVV
jgi:hypothetical protein